MEDHAQTDFTRKYVDRILGRGHTTGLGVRLIVRVI